MPHSRWSSSQSMTAPPVPSPPPSTRQSKLYCAAAGAVSTAVSSADHAAAPSTALAEDDCARDRGGPASAPLLYVDTVTPPCAPKPWHCAASASNRAQQERIFSQNTQQC